VTPPCIRTIVASRSWQRRSTPTREVDSLPRHPEPPTAEHLLVPIVYAIGGETVRLLTTIATIGDAHDLTLAELRIETFWPMDESSRWTWADHMGEPA
jgi:hypothetical protein